MLLKSHHVTTGDIGESFVNMGFGPCQIVAFFGGDFSNALVDELAHGILNRGEVAAFNVSAEPSYLFGRKANAHAFFCSTHSGQAGGRCLSQADKLPVFLEKPHDLAIGSDID